MKKIMFLGFSLIIFGIILIIIILKIPSSEEGMAIEDISEQEIINNCINLSLEDTSKCLVSHTKKFFIFNETLDKFKLSFEDLKERGGDCRNWAFYYERMGKKLGFTSTTYRLDLNKEKAHRFAVLSGGNGYCVIDQKSLWCNKFKDGENGD